MQQDGQGGLPARATLIGKLSKDKKSNEILILDSGNIVLGRPESNLYNGETDLAGMNAIGYFASGVGYSELRLSLNGFKNLNKKANFYYLCSNVYDTKNKEICDRYIVKKVGNYSNYVKIGFISLISEDVVKALPENIRKQYVVVDPIESAKLCIKELKSPKNNVDLVIALTYLGYYDDESIVSSRTLAESVEGIDIIIDGRTAIKFEEPVTVNNTKIYQAFKWGLFLGEIDLSIKNKKIDNSDYKVHPVNYKIDKTASFDILEDDKKTLSAIKNKMSNYDKLINKPIAKIENENLDPKYSKFRETEIGNLICDAMLDYTGVDVAFQNAGGIGTVVIQSGQIKRNGLDDLIKYDNSLVILYLTGDEIIKLLEFSVNNQGKGGFLQVAGIRFVYSKKMGRIIEAKINNQDVIRSNYYKVVINSWLADGGDGYKIFTQIKDKINLSILHREIVYNYLEKLKIYTPFLDGRIKIID
jgi:2',3'-cyclic-nucleotide 2'-phosphodiesterase (5'-nucleotidase family)